MRVYLDNCCYNRLFDDRRNIKNYLEREAVLIVMQKAFEKELEVVGSDILEIEMLKINNEEKKNDVVGVYNALVSERLKVSDEIVQRAAQIREISKIKAFDSLHLAMAEAETDILLTTDIKFLRGVQKVNSKIATKNPVEFVMEVIEYDESNDENS